MANGIKCNRRMRGSVIQKRMTEKHKKSKDSNRIYEEQFKKIDVSKEIVFSLNETLRESLS